MSKKVKSLRKRWVFVGLVLVVALFVTVALLGLPWYVGAIAFPVAVFAVLWGEGEAEGRQLEREFGPWRKPSEDFVTKR